MRLFFATLFAALALFVVAQPTFAQTNNNANTTASTSSTSQCDKLKQQFTNTGGNDIAGSLPIYCSTSAVYTKIVNILYYIIGIAAVIALIYGGYIYMTARGNATQAARGRTIVIWALIGLAVAILAAVIVDVVVRFVVDNR